MQQTSPKLPTLDHPDRYITAEHLQLVLVALRAKRHNPSLARFAAISNGAQSTRQCTARRVSSAIHRCWRTPPMLYPLLPSVRPDLVERVRLVYGLPEVKRTWGLGYKAMLASLQRKAVQP